MTDVPRRRKTNTYIQFSKRIVVIVTACVTLISFVGIIACWCNADMSSAVDIIRTYIQYAMVVFAAYSGNSMVEKWLVKRFAITSDNEQEAEG